MVDWWILEGYGIQLNLPTVTKQSIYLRRQNRNIFEYLFPNEPEFYLGRTKLIACSKIAIFIIFNAGRTIFCDNYNYYHSIKNNFCISVENYIMFCLI